MITTSLFSDILHFDDLPSKAYHQRISPSLFFPIGTKVEEADDIDVYLFPVDYAAPIDEEWLTTRFPSDPCKLSDQFKEAFGQYCGEGWCGADMREDVVSDLAQFESQEYADLFQTEGYVPFFQIQSIYLCQAIDSIVFSGRTEIDLNLLEHGIDIKLNCGKVTFGYAGEILEQDFGT
jgi:hypothetical protein